MHTERVSRMWLPGDDAMSLEMLAMLVVATAAAFVAVLWDMRM